MKSFPGIHSIQEQCSEQLFRFTEEPIAASGVSFMEFVSAFIPNEAPPQTKDSTRWWSAFDSCGNENFPNSESIQVKARRALLNIIEIHQEDDGRQGVEAMRKYHAFDFMCKIKGHQPTRS